MPPKRKNTGKNGGKDKGKKGGRKQKEEQSDSEAPAEVISTGYDDHDEEARTSRVGYKKVEEGPASKTLRKDTDKVKPHKERNINQQAAAGGSGGGGDDADHDGEYF